VEMVVDVQMALVVWMLVATVYVCAMLALKVVASARWKRHSIRPVSARVCDNK